MKPCEFCGDAGSPHNAEEFYRRLKSDKRVTVCVCGAVGRPPSLVRRLVLAAKRLLWRVLQ